MPQADKMQMEYLCLCEEKEFKTQDEMLYELVLEEFDHNDLPILYEESRFVSAEILTEAGKKFVTGIQKSILREAGFEFINNVLFELKFKKN